MMRDPTLTTWKRDVNTDNLVIPLFNIEDLGGETPRCANIKAIGGSLNYKLSPFA